LRAVSGQRLSQVLLRDNKTSFDSTPAAAAAENGIFENHFADEVGTEQSAVRHESNSGRAFIAQPDQTPHGIVVECHMAELR